MSYGAEFRRGSGIVASAAIGIALGLSPLPFYTLGVFAPHLAEEFGWTMAQIMAGLSIMTVIVVLAGPVAGWLADRYGVRRITLASLVLFALALMGFSLLDGDIRRYWLTWGIMTTVGMGTMPATWTRAINVWFEEGKGLALGLALTGTGIAGMVLPTYTHAMIIRFGWRGGYLALALLPFAISGYQISLATQMLIYATLAMSIDILAGYGYALSEGRDRQRHLWSGQARRHAEQDCQGNEVGYGFAGANAGRVVSRKQGSICR